jgi:hypothetical protein
MSFKDLFIIRSIHSILGKKIKIVTGKTKPKSKRNTLIFLGDDNRPENMLKWKNK